MNLMRRTLKSGDGVDVEIDAGLILLGSIASELDEHICSE
ncbi:hypothetical protein VII_003774 [Vibrio mimicus MB451]|nr:hypothetical protein VII_003774 [Vibrio mimicus MB451]